MNTRTSSVLLDPKEVVMRRKNKEITDSDNIFEILHKAEVVHLAMVDEKEPYLVSMNYGFKDNALYLHSALEGRKIDILKHNNRVAFTVETDVSLLLGEGACDCTTSYKSVFGTGFASFVEGLEGKAEALNIIMEKHSGRGDYTFPEALLTRTAIIRIDIDSLSGKRSG